MEPVAIDSEYNHRYLFIVRQGFGKDPHIDSFHELQVPAGLTSRQAQVMRKLKGDFIEGEIKEDTGAMHGMSLRLRFNSDMFQSVCLVRTTTEITSDDLELIINEKHKRGDLLEFLEESAIQSE